MFNNFQTLESFITVGIKVFTIYYRRLQHLVNNNTPTQKFGASFIF